jgi:biotin carboxylase
MVCRLVFTPAVTPLSGETTNVNICLLCHWPIAGYQLVRALRELGCKIHLIYDDTSTSLALSRGIVRVHRFRNLDRTAPDQLADVVNQLHARIGVDRVVAADMESLLTLAWAEEDVEPAVYPMAPPEVLHRLNDKWEFVKLCGEVGIPTPRSMRVRARDYKAEQVADEIGFPLVIKPIDKYGGRDIRIANDQLELVQKLDEKYGVPRHKQTQRPGQFRPHGHHYAIVQEYVQGQDWGCSIFARAGRIEHWTTFKCPDFKSAEFLPHARLLRACARIVRDTEFTGVANFDARETFDGHLALFECNPRFFTRLSACRMLGMDFVEAGLAPPKEARSPHKLSSGEYYHWTQLLQPHGYKGLLTGRWKLDHLLKDLTELLSDPLPIVARKLRVI